MMFRGSGIKGMPIGPGNPHQSASPLLTTSSTTLPQMSSVTFFKSSDCENSLQFWEGASSGPATQSPRRERHPSTRPVFARLDTPRLRLVPLAAVFLKLAVLSVVPPSTTTAPIRTSPSGTTRNTPIGATVRTLCLVSWCLKLISSYRCLSTIPSS